MVSLLASYPRSGNHMVRAFLEAASGQPTLGCRGNPNDTPIRDRFSTNVDAPFERLSDEPNAQKMHSIHEELSFRKDGHTVERMCMIVRDPARCIVSQLIRDLEEQNRIKQWKTFRKRRKPKRLERLVLSELEKWYVLIDHYLASDLPKLIISFEDLLSENGVEIINDQLLPFFGISNRFDGVANMRRVADFGRESQNSNVKTLSENVYNDNRRISDIVRSVIDYNGLRSRLGLPSVETIS